MDFIGDDDANTADVLSDYMDKNTVAKDLLEKRPKACGVLSFHSGTEEMMFLHLAKVGSVDEDCDSILDSIDRFCYGLHWMMHVGERKALLLQNAVKEKLSEITYDNIVAIEIGSYCGYSACKIASLLPLNSRLICIEINKKCCDWTLRLLKLAKLDHKVIIINNNIQEGWNEVLSTIKNIRSGGIDMLFIDHDKSQYLNDLLFLESTNTLKMNALVVADNVLSFGIPLNEYLDHVRDTKFYFKSDLHVDFIEYCDVSVENSDLIDGLEISYYKKANDRIYLDNTYLFTLSNVKILQVIELNAENSSMIERSKGTHKIILDRTIFHPQGGGQPSDTGFIIMDGVQIFKINICLVNKVSDAIEHFGGFVGSAISCRTLTKCTICIDETTRLNCAKFHSGGHVIDSALYRVDPTLIQKFVATKGYHFMDGPYVEYKIIDNSSYTQEFLDDLQRGLNTELDSIIAENIITNVTTVPKDEAKQICDILDFCHYPSNVRIVSVAGVSIPCGGTHVRSTKELTGMIVTKLKIKKNVLKISYAF